MSAEQKPTSWGAQAQGLAKRIAAPVGVLMTFAVFAGIVVPALVRERKPRLRPPSDQAVPLTVGWLDQSEAPARKGRDLPPVDPATVMKPTPALLARGDALFKQNCVSCHGDTGRGDGPAAATLNPRPRNLAQPDGWKRGYRITDIFTTITTGIKGTGMNPFDFIAPADRMGLVHYVRSLGAFDHGPEDAAATAALENQFRSKGMHIPNRIPVSLAINKMVAEQSPPPSVPAPSGDNLAAALLRSAVVDRDRAARTVASTRHSEEWRAVARAWTAGAPGNGFAPSVAAMTGDQWQTLVSLMLGRPANAEPPHHGEIQVP
jgi:mono/diheme cytochrome c family protein